jgi:glycerol-3-phosphate acyltransferase PlsX
MEDSAARAVRSKPNSSLRVASRLVKNCIAHGLVSAGNTGAVMATAKIVQGVVPGVDRPALAGIFPTLKGVPVVVVDVGANVDCSSPQLSQFAVMAEIYSRMVIRTRPRPRVGVLSIGEEEHKGNDLTRSVAVQLKQLSLNFVGNVEGRDALDGGVDVIVSDGFGGNIFLKTAEGVAMMLFTLLKKELTASLPRKLAAAVLKKGFKSVKAKLDYTEHGGALLLGIDGVAVKAHGSSNARAFENALMQAKRAVERDVVGSIRQSLVSVLENV